MASLPVIDQPARRSAVLLEQLARRMRRRSEAALEPLGMRSRHLVALTVVRDAGDPTQQDLAGFLRMDRTNLVGLLNELEADGLVERRRSEADRRRHLVALTDAGRRRLATAEFALNVAEDEVLGALTREQRDALHDLLWQAVFTDDDGACDAPPGAPRRGASAGTPPDGDGGVDCGPDGEVTCEPDAEVDCGPDGEAC